MKTLSMNILKSFASLSFVILLLTSACGQTGSSSEKEAVNNTKAKAIKEVPEMSIQAAILSDNYNVVAEHIKAGTDIDKKDAMSGSTPLITAASFGKNQIARALIDAGADLSIKNNDGATALHVAAFFGRVEIVQMLIDADADKTIRNNFGATARESVMGPFDQIKPVYEMLQQQLGPLGLELDLNEIEKIRPVIAMMLQ
jgi:ankyrin repeat protein